MTEEEDEYPSVAIIVLNWNGWEDTIECLESVYHINYPNYEVVVVDNGSRDDSIQKIKKYTKGKIRPKMGYIDYKSDNKPIKVLEVEEREGKLVKSKGKDLRPLPSEKKMVLIKNSKNYGFSRGNNIGIKYSLKKGFNYVLLLNNDTIVKKDFLLNLVKNAESEKNIGIVGAKIYYYNFRGRQDVISALGTDFNYWNLEGKRYGLNEVDRGQWHERREVDKVEGACMLLKRKLIEDVGLFDTDYFTYWEETDFCYRATSSGYKIVSVPEAAIWHKIGSSSGGSLSNHFIYYMTRNRLLFIKKNLNSFQKLTSLLFALLIHFPNRLSRLIFRKKAEGLLSFFRGLKDGLISSTSA
ncbi:hypothetical protein AKJ37_07130 [candidate division MSBL1 archaeon SCGC-AAA259I09]|uniref:Glycosyltransferase 2-like domain-containing protein n=1 Tax=candidate division MSBL1 archaeon SCGC-AAA259I09 TaxID=1698267 RepID=A0A133UL85_9EURY|nr:hypothetical protein AKJ37_07130 [candidate division MSBL1 archaeon SCGC-AAA259I09]